jgi:hypothetical protein
MKKDKDKFLKHAYVERGVNNDSIKCSLCGRALKDDEDMFFTTYDHALSKIRERELSFPFILIYCGGITVFCKTCRDRLLGENLQLWQMTESELRERGIDPTTCAIILQMFLKQKGIKLP